MQYLIGTDAETGDLDPKKGDLLTIYISVIDENYKILDELDLLLKPDNGRLPIANSEALKKNGIDLQEHLANPSTIPYSEAKKKIIDMLKKYREGGRYRNQRLYGYNVGFDKKFILEHLLTQEEYDNLFHYKIVDVMETVDALKRYGWLPPRVGTLVSIVEHFGLQMGKAHTAKDDVLMTVDVDKKFKELFNSKKNGGQEVDLIALLEAE
jgi:oligoribonuclease (3'-5' exoribonuclease)